MIWSLSTTLATTAVCTQLQYAKKKGANDERERCLRRTFADSEGSDKALAASRGPHCEANQPEEFAIKHTMIGLGLKGSIDLVYIGYGRISSREPS